MTLCPGMFTTKNEKINIIEALAQAGDLTLFGERDKVFLIRENSEGQKEYHQLDLNDAGVIAVVITWAVVTALR